MPSQEFAKSRSDSQSPSQTPLSIFSSSSQIITRPFRGWGTHLKSSNSSETTPGQLISNSLLFRHCQSYPDPINTLNPTINYKNYDTYSFTSPCGRLPVDFPTDQFSFFQSFDDQNFIIPIEAYDTTPFGSSLYSGPAGSVVNDQRFVSGMVG